MGCIQPKKKSVEATGDVFGWVRGYPANGVGCVIRVCQYLSPTGFVSDERAGQILETKIGQSVE